MEAECSLSALPRIQEFLSGFASQHGWGQVMQNRLDTVAEETLLTLFQRDGADDAPETRRLQLVLCSQSLFRFPDLGDDGFG